MLDIRTTGSGHVRVNVRGELDLAHAPSMRNATTTLLNRGDIIGVDLDLTGVTFIDATGAGTLIVAHRIATNVRVALRLAAVSAPVAQVMVLAGAGDLLPGPCVTQAWQPRNAAARPLGPGPMRRSAREATLGGRARRTVRRIGGTARPPVAAASCPDQDDEAPGRPVHGGLVNHGVP